MESKALKIRYANPKDINLLAAVGAATFYEAYYESDNPCDLSDYIISSFSPSQIESEFNDPSSTFFIAEMESYAVGYAKLREGTFEPCLKKSNSIELQRLYLIQAVWGSGLGRTLLDRCCAEAFSRGFESIWLGVWEHNPRAIAFYESQGFDRAGELKFMYGANLETNLVMEKIL